MRPLLLSVAVALVLVVPSFGHAEDYSITIKDHRFQPEKITIPANQRVKLIVKNEDATAEEFESEDLDIEKIIAGNSEATVFVRPQKPGTYTFFGEFNPKTAQGTLVVE